MHVAKILREALQAMEKTGSFRPRTPTVEEHFLAIARRSYLTHKASTHPSFRCIPRLTSLARRSQTELATLLRRESRLRYLQKRAEALMENDDLEVFWAQLSKSSSPPEDGRERINWGDFVRVRDTLPIKCRRYFSGQTFLRFARDEYGRIPLLPFFQYVMRRVTLEQTRISLSFYDPDGTGFLHEQDLENYIFEIIPSLAGLRDLEEHYYPFYVCGAVRKFMFFLDPMRRGRVSIVDILTCPILEELFEMRLETLSLEEEQANWFSSATTMRVYGQYLQMDADRNGMLSKEELSSYGSGAITNTFLTHLFQEYMTYSGEMDYKAYLDFVLAQENKRSTASLQYYWRVLDTRRRGCLTAFDINYFFKEIVQKMDEVGEEPVSVVDVKDEIFDMVRPVDPLCITFDDLCKSKAGDVIVTILTDAAGFWQYDNREALPGDLTDL